MIARKPGIGEDHLVEALRRRVAVVGGLDVEDQRVADRRQAAEERGRGRSRALRAAAVAGALGLAREAEAGLDLALELLAQGREQVADVERQVLVGQVLATVVARVEELEQQLDDVVDLAARREVAAVDVLAAGVAPVAREHRVDQPRQRAGGAVGHRRQIPTGAACALSTSVNIPSKSAPER